MFSHISKGPLEDKTPSDYGTLLWDPAEGQQQSGPVEELQKSSREKVEGKTPSLFFKPNSFMVHQRENSV